ncbi:MAG: DUF1080 domain-containing protein [Planctomycetes bacterium]|nr:DUF1080 domain-containing protein [Planctomycetota bacterium]
MKSFRVCWVLAVAILGGVFSGSISAGEYLSGIQWAEPPVVDPGPPGGPPSDAVVLFDGKDMSQWIGAEKWTVKDGYVVAGPGSIRSKAEFGDCQVHLEFAAPEKVTGSGQGRGNSGVFLMGIYEVQILDSYNNKTYFDGQCGAIYKQHPPLVNACRKPGEWQTYDIIWTAPRFDKNGKLVSPAFVTVLHNGVVIQNHFQLLGDTPYHRAPEYRPHPPKGPLGLQYHGNPVRFRNIWVRELKELPHKRVHEPKIVEHGPKKKPAKKRKPAAKRKPAKKAQKKPAAKSKAPAEKSKKPASEKKPSAKSTKCGDAGSGCVQKTKSGCVEND